MLRESNFSYDHADEDLSVWPVLIRKRIDDHAYPAVFDEALSLRSGPSLPDVPSSVGLLLFSSYLSLIGALAFATVSSGASVLAIAVALFFVVMFFAVPKVMLAQEAGLETRPSLERFLAEGMMTYTGHSTGAAALVQMLIVPVALTGGVLAIAAVIALS